MNKKLIIMFGLFFLLVSLVSSGNYIDYDFTFGNSEFSIDGCFYNTSYNYNNFLLSDKTTVNNKDWYCIIHPDQIGVNEMKNYSVFYNTLYSAVLNHNAPSGGCSSPSNCRSFYATFLDEPFIFDSNSYIDFYCKRWGHDTTGTPPDGGIILTNKNMNEDGVALNFLRLNPDYNCNGIGNPTEMGLPCCNIFSELDFNSMCSNDTALQHMTIDYDRIIDKCSGVTSVNLTDLDTIMFWVVDNSDVSPIIDDMTIHIFNGTNELPILNITPDVSIPCVEKQDTSYIFNFTIDSFDFENDTIYYSIQNVRTFTPLNQTQIKYEKTPLLFTYPDYSFLANTYFSSDSCDINKESELGFNTSQINLLEHNDFDNVQRWMMGLSSSCNGDSEFTYILPNSYFNLFYYTSIYGFQSTNESLNISFYSSDFNLISRVKYVVYNSTVIQIYNYNGNDFSQLGNFSLETILDVAFKIYNSNNNFTLENLRNSGIYVLSMLQNESVKYIKLENENGVIYQNGFTYSGVSYDLESDFSLSKPNNITIYHKGISSTSFVTVKVTDNLHLGDSYNSESIPVTSILCEDKVEFTTNPSIIKGFLGLKNGIYEACSKLDTAFGINFLCSGLNLFYILIIFGISFMTSFVIGSLAKNIGLGMFLILFGIGVLIGNLFLVLSAITNFIFVIIWLFGIIVMFRAFFGHGEGIGE